MRGYDKQALKTILDHCIENVEIEIINERSGCRCIVHTVHNNEKLTEPYAGLGYDIAGVETFASGG